MTPHVLTFTESGEGHCLYTEAIELASIGRLTMRRATSVEFAERRAQGIEVTDLRLDGREVTHWLSFRVVFRFGFSAGRADRTE